jgi:hypothetical protein
MVDMVWHIKDTYGVCKYVKKTVLELVFTWLVGEMEPSGDMGRGEPPLDWGLPERCMYRIYMRR